MFAFWMGGAGQVSNDGSLVFSEFELEGLGTFFEVSPGPEPCVPCIDRRILVTMYGWGLADLSTQFTFYPCGEEKLPGATSTIGGAIRPLKKN